MAEKYLDITLPAKERAQDLLSRLSLEEKMAQTRCAFPGTGNSDKLKEDCRFGIGEISTLEIRNMETLEEAAAFQKKIQEMVMENSPHHIPAIFHMEGLCGAFIQGAASFPSGIGRASSFDPELEECVAGIVARQERAVGISILSPRYWIFQEIPGWADRGKPMGKIRHLPPLWERLISEGCRREKQRDFVPKLSQSIGSAFIIQRAASTVPPAIRRAAC